MELFNEGLKTGLITSGIVTLLSNGIRLAIKYFK